MVCDIYDIEGMIEAAQELHLSLSTVTAERDAAIARVSALEEALRPFADEADAWSEFSDQDELVEPWPEGPESNLKVHNLRAAREALEGKQ